MASPVITNNSRSSGTDDPVTLTELYAGLTQAIMWAGEAARLGEQAMQCAEQAMAAVGPLMTPLHARIERNRARSERARHHNGHHGNGNGHVHGSDVRLVLARHAGIVRECRKCGGRVVA